MSLLQSNEEAAMLEEDQWRMHFDGMPQSLHHQAHADQRAHVAFEHDQQDKWNTEQREKQRDAGESTNRTGSGAEERRGSDVSKSMVQNARAHAARRLRTNNDGELHKHVQEALFPPSQKRAPRGARQGWAFDGLFYSGTGVGDGGDVRISETVHFGNKRRACSAASIDGSSRCEPSAVRTVPNKSIEG